MLDDNTVTPLKLLFDCTDNQILAAVWYDNLPLEKIFPEWHVCDVFPTRDEYIDTYLKNHPLRNRKDAVDAFEIACEDTKLYDIYDDAGNYQPPPFDVALKHFPATMKDFVINKKYCKYICYRGFLYRYIKLTRSSGLVTYLYYSCLPAVLQTDYDKAYRFGKCANVSEPKETLGEIKPFATWFEYKTDPLVKQALIDIMNAPVDDEEGEDSENDSDSDEQSSGVTDFNQSVCTDISHLKSLNKVSIDLANSVENLTKATNSFYYKATQTLLPSLNSSIAKALTNTYVKTIEPGLADAIEKTQSIARQLSETEEAISKTKDDGDLVAHKTLFQATEIYESTKQLNQHLEKQIQYLDSISKSNSLSIRDIELALAGQLNKIETANDNTFASLRSLSNQLSAQRERIADLANKIDSQSPVPISHTLESRMAAIESATRNILREVEYLRANNHSVEHKQEGNQKKDQTKSTIAIAVCLAFALGALLGSAAG